MAKTEGSTRNGSASLKPETQPAARTGRWPAQGAAVELQIAPQATRWWAAYGGETASDR